MTGSSSEESSSDSSTSSTTSSSSSSSEDDSSSSTSLVCAGSPECADDEVCVEFECVDAWSVPYVFVVSAFDEPCDGFGTEQFFARVAGEDTSLFPGCPQSWPGEAWTLPAGGSATIQFFEKGASPNPDVMITSWSWAGPVPKEVLHEAAVEVTWDTWSATVVFTAVAG